MENVGFGRYGDTQSTRVPSSCSKENLNTSSDLRVDRGLPHTGNTHTHTHIHKITAGHNYTTFCTGLTTIT
ncbi:Chaperone protein dnaK [Dirofilaria immitis]